MPLILVKQDVDNKGSNAAGGGFIPAWQGGRKGDMDLLASYYARVLEGAGEHGLESVTLPLIPDGSSGYHKDQALRTATDTVRSFLDHNDMTVYIAIPGDISSVADKNIRKAVSHYISDNLWKTGSSRLFGRTGHAGMRMDMAASASRDMCTLEDSAASEDLSSLYDRLDQPDESFSEMLLRKIDESGMTDVECYKKANIDRKLFSKIRSDRFYKPGKATVIAFAIALKLSISDTRELLGKAGYALSRSNKFDIIVEFFIENKEYDVITINEVLFAFDQPLLA